MKNSQYRLSRLKYQLKERKRNGEKSVTWKLNKEQKEYLEGLGYQIIPVLYAINTKKIQVTPGSNGLIKYINRASTGGKNRIFRNLKATELKELNELGISYAPFKYKIILQ